MTTISYTRRGSGRPLVLVHGIGHQRTAWGDTVDALAEDFDVIAVDLPGFGASAPPADPDGYSVSGYADRIGELIDELDLGTPHVAGNSLGGAIGLELGRRGRVASVTALSPGGFWGRRPNPSAVIRLLALKGLTYAPEAVIRACFDRVAVRRALLRSLYCRAERVPVEVAMAEAVNLRDSPGFFGVVRANTGLRVTGPIDVPVTIAWGTRDRILPIRQSELARTVLPGARLVPLWCCGHVPMVDDPEAVAEVIRTTAGRAA